MGVHENPWHTIFTILWFGTLYFYPLMHVGGIRMQRRSRYLLLLNNTLIMIVNVFYCVQVRSFGQVAGCVSHAYEWVYLNGMNIFTKSFRPWRHAAWIYCKGILSPRKTTTENNAGEKMAITASNRSCARQKESLETGSSVFRYVFVCVTLELAGLFESNLSAQG